MASISTGFPNTWVAKIAWVSWVIMASMDLGDILRLSGSISANTKLQFSQAGALVVATLENGVVMTSFVILSAFKAI